MYRGETVAVVVPAYNEAGFVGDVIASVPAFVDRIYPVDDASTDDTWAEIRAAAERAAGGGQRANGDGPTASEDGGGPTTEADGAFDRRVVPLRHERNRGVGGAIKTGYQRALADEVDVTAVMGGDGQMRPGALASIVHPVATGRADYAKGDRLDDPDYHAEMPRLRYVGNRILTQLTRVASGYWSIEDPQNGYTAVSLSALETLDVDEMFEFYGYCNDLLVKCNVAGLRVVDVPQRATYEDEESHIEYRTYVPKVSGMLARNAIWRYWHQYVGGKRHPIALFLGVGLVAGTASVRRGLARLRGDRDARPGEVLVLALTALAAALAVDREHADHLDGRVDHDVGDEPGGSGASDRAKEAPSARENGRATEDRPSRDGSEGSHDDGDGIAAVTDGDRGDSDGGDGPIQIDGRE